MIRTLKVSVALAVAAVAGACGATLPGTSTGSLFGGSTAPAAQANPNDPTARAFQVGRTAARAQKCGFNFDAVKLRTQFIATESGALPNAADSQKLTQIYDTAYAGTTKAIAVQGEEYCTPAKTKLVKEALNRHIAGDYAPGPPEIVPQEESLFGSLSSGSTDPETERKLRHPDIGN